MADTKITALTALTGADPANDVIPIVDVSDTTMAASGTTKKISVNNILGASGTATLASATITGDLTVDTNVLKVDTTNNVVGIGTATPNDWGAKFVSLRSTTGISYTGVWNDGANSPRLEIGHTSTGSYLNASSASGGSYSRLRFQVAGADQYQIDTSGVFTWYDGAGGTRMTLNSTGLGVGGTAVNGIKLLSAVTTAGLPATSGTTQSAGSLRIAATDTTGCLDIGTAGAVSWLQACRRTNLADNFDLALNPNGGNIGIGVASPAFKLDVAGSSGSGIRFTGNSVSTVMGETGGFALLGTTTNHNLGLYTNGSVKATIDTSGNVGIGVTPITGAGLLQFPSGNLIGNQSDNFGLSSNAKYVGGYKYVTGGKAALMYLQQNGIHSWHNSAVGANANDPLTFTQAMTLDASGNLLVGKSSASATTIGFEGRANGTVNSTLASSVDANATYAAYSTGAAAYRFYVGMGGTVYATNTTISAISDARLKENVQDIDVGLGAILALKPRKFDWKEGKGKNIKGDRGFIAQEFEQVFPQLVDEWKDAAPEGEAPYKSVRQDLIPVLVKAIQELAAEVNALKNA